MPESKTIAPFPSPSHPPLSWRGTRNRTSAWMVSSQAPFLKATVEKGWGPKALPKGRRPLRQLLLSCSVTSNSLRPRGWQHARPPCPSLFPKVCPNSLSWWCHLILCCPLLLLPSIFPSIRLFSSESALCIRWPKYWSFSISPSNEHSGLISFRINWFDLAAQETLKSLLQHHSLKTSILPCSLRSNSHIRTWSRRVLTGQTRPLFIRPTANKNYREASNLDYKHPQC